MWILCLKVRSLVRMKIKIWRLINFLNSLKFIITDIENLRYRCNYFLSENFTFSRNKNFETWCGKTKYQSIQTVFGGEELTVDEFRWVVTLIPVALLNSTPITTFPYLMTFLYLSHLMTKPTKWLCAQWRLEISLGIRPVWSESSLCAHCALEYSGKTACSCIPDRHFRVTDQCKEMSSYTRGCKTTLVHEVRMYFWHHDISLWCHFLPNVSTTMS